MSKHDELVDAIYDAVLAQGNRNGQRWHVEKTELLAIVEATTAPKPAPAKKVSKKASTKKDKGDESDSAE